VTAFAKKNLPIEQQRFPWSAFEDNRSSVLLGVRQGVEMPLKSPFAMSTDEVHTSVWTLQEWTENSLTKDRLPFVFNVQAPTSSTPVPQRTGTIQQRRKLQRVDSDDGEEEESGDERIVEPHSGDAIG